MWKKKKSKRHLKFHDFKEYSFRKYRSPSTYTHDHSFCQRLKNHYYWISFLNDKSICKHPIHRYKNNAKYLMVLSINITVIERLILIVINFLFFFLLIRSSISFIFSFNLIVSINQSVIKYTKNRQKKKDMGDIAWHVFQLLLVRINWKKCDTHLRSTSVRSRGQKLVWKRWGVAPGHRPRFRWWNQHLNRRLKFRRKPHWRFFFFLPSFFFFNSSNKYRINVIWILDYALD